MRALFTTWPSASHLAPLVPLAWALQAAGHDVRMASLPALTPATNAAGLTPVEVGSPPPPAALAAWHEQLAWPPDWPHRSAELGPERQEVLDALSAKSVRMAAAMAGDLTAFARSWRPDVVVYDGSSFAGPVAASALGVPALAQLWGQAALHRQDQLAADGRPRPDYLALFDEQGAPRRTEPDRWLDPCPPALRMPGEAPRTDVRYVPYNGPGEFPAELLDPPGRPRICVTWGRTAAALRGPALPDLIRATLVRLARLPVELLLATTVDPASLGVLPDRVRVLHAVPLRALLPTCAAVLHHGGGGTILTAVHAGVPQVVLSPRPEQMITGRRLEAVGAGRHHVFNELAADPEAGADVAAADLEEVMIDGPHRAAAAALRADMQRLPSPAEIAEDLEAQLAGAAPSPAAGS